MTDMTRKTTCPFCKHSLSWMTNTCYTCGTSWSQGVTGEIKGGLFETREDKGGTWKTVPEGCLVVRENQGKTKIE